MIMITIANCHNLGEAQQFKMILDSVGIPSFIPDEASAGIAPHHFLTDSGVRLQVANENAEEAKNILDDVRGKR